MSREQHTTAHVGAGEEPRITLPNVGGADARCDAEPIHIPGGIQPHGYLLCLSDEMVILQASENVAGLTGKPLDALLGNHVDTIVGARTAARIAHAAATAMLDESPLYLGIADADPEHDDPRDGVDFDVTLHRHDGALIVELESAHHVNTDVFASMYPLVRTFTRSLQNVSSVRELADLAVREVREMTGFGRVLLYSFDDEGRSQVLAEHVDDGYASFMNQVFPASDIPRQARALYLKNRVRLVADVNAAPARIVPPLHPETGRPTDLTYATLRSFSPIHLQYMRNMGTFASMSVSLIVRGKLWGLISCHDHDPRFVPFEVRMAIEHLGHILSLQIEAKEERAEGEYLLSLRHTVSRLIASMSEHDDYIEGLTAEADNLLCFAGTAGVGIVVDEQVTLIGSTPDEDTVLA